MKVNGSKRHTLQLKHLVNDSTALQECPKSKHLR